MMARLPGTSNAAAAPCTARAAISRSADGAAPQSSDAAPNPHRPDEKHAAAAEEIAE